MKSKMCLGDCLEVMGSIEPGSVDMILADLPYGVTRNKWDSIINMDAMWHLFKKVTKPTSPIVLFGQGGFSAKLITSNTKMYRYSLVWEKTNASGHLNANRMPLRAHEDILVFYSRPPIYNPQKTSGHKRRVSTAKHKRNSNLSDNYGSYGLTSYDSTERYPRSVLKYKKDTQKTSLHPNQKPVSLLEYLIKTYSNEGDTVLDPCAGSGSSGIACRNTKRRYLMIESDPEYYKIIKNRINGHQ